MQTGFNPEVGFIRRRNNSQYQGEATFNPQMRQSDLIRTLDFSSSVDYYKSGTTGEIETRVQDASMGLTFKTGANANHHREHIRSPDRARLFSIPGIALASRRLPVSGLLDERGDRQHAADQRQRHGELG